MPARDVDPELFTGTFHAGQSRTYLALRTHRIVSMVAGTGSGKTWMAPRIIYEHIRENLDATYLFLEPNYRMIKRVMLPCVLRFFDALGLGKMNLTDLEYRFHKRWGRGRILFGSMDNADSIQGIHVNGMIWSDEIGLYTEEAWDAILQRSALYKCKILNTTTPYTLPWMEKRLYKPTLDPRTRDEYWITQFPSYWNPMYSMEQYWTLKHMWPEAKFKRIMEGLFTQITGLCFEDFDEQKHLVQIKYLDGMQIQVRYQGGRTELARLVNTWMAQDWGWSPDPGVQLLLGQDEMGRIYVLEEDYETYIPVERGTDEGADTWTNRALARISRWNCEACYCDPSRPENIADLQRHGVPAVGANNRIDYGIDEVNTAFRTGNLFINLDGCPNLHRTIGQYVRAKMPGGEGYLNKPADHQDDHSLDALRYAITKTNRPSETTGVYLPMMIASVRRKG